MAAGVGKNSHGCPQSFEAIFESGGLQNRTRAHFQALLAPYSEIEELVLGNAAGRSDRTPLRRGG